MAPFFWTRFLSIEPFRKEMDMPKVYAAEFRRQAAVRGPDLEDQWVSWQLNSR